MNSKRNTVYAFDFDGTLTTHDTFLAFIRHSCGLWNYLWGMTLHAPWLVMMLLGLYPNWKAKQHVFAHFFKGMSIDDFNQRCWFFAYDYRHLFRPQGIQAIRRAQAEGAQVLVVSASVENWVERCLEAALATAPHTGDTPTDVAAPIALCTKVEVKDGLLTGRLLGKNCYGPEKVERIKAMLPHREEYTLIAFGDSRGDKELLEYADERHFKPFRR